MTGALYFVRSLDQEPPFTRVRLDFANDGHLKYTNKRMIGRVDLVEDTADFIIKQKLGPDALDPRFDFFAFQAAVRGLTRNVKSVLMDQQIVAGIGNIYSDEILFQARINPATHIDQLTPAQPKHLFLEMRKVLKTAIAHGAGSEEFIERMPKGVLLPERKKGGSCPRCGSLLKVLKVGGRTAYFCPHCQPLQPRSARLGQDDGARAIHWRLVARRVNESSHAHPPAT
jgi:formamidopyrimidine-DNA glycosylase